MAKPPARRPLSAGDAVRAAISSSVQRLLDHESRVFAGRDGEAVHQARVAVRRLRSDLKSFRPLVDRQWSDSLRQELRGLGGELGAVRDLDVFLDRIRGDAASAGTAALRDSGVLAVIAHVRADRTAARKRLLAGMRSDAYAQLRARLVEAARTPKTTLAAILTARKALAPIVKRRWKRLRQAVEALPRRPAVRALHRIRILAKRCRYAAEAAIGAFGAPAHRFALAAAALQDSLGDLNDAEAARARLRRFRNRPETTVAAIALLAIEDDAASKARESWPDAWRMLANRKLRSWL